MGDADRLGPRGRCSDARRRHGARRGRDVRRALGSRPDALYAADQRGAAGDGCAAGVARRDLRRQARVRAAVAEATAGRRRHASRVARARPARRADHRLHRGRRDAVGGLGALGTVRRGDLLVARRHFEARSRHLPRLLRGPRCRAARSGVRRRRRQRRAWRARSASGWTRS